MAPVEIGAGLFPGGEFQEGPVPEHGLDEGAILLLGSVTPVDPIRPGEPGALVDPVGHGFVQRRGGHGGVISCLPSGRQPITGEAILTPMRPALALSIDADGCTVERLHRVFRYWATSETTEFGPGLRLPMASSMFAYSRNSAAPPQAAYLDGQRDGLLEAWRLGWIDTLHGLGDFTAAQPCTRDLARRPFQALAADGVRLKVWTNHGGQENGQNLLRPWTLGDVPGSPCYLADLAGEYGIRFLWASELTPVIGQERAATAGEYYAAH